MEKGRPFEGGPFPYLKDAVECVRMLLQDPQKNLSVIPAKAGIHALSDRRQIFFAM